MKQERTKNFAQSWLDTQCLSIEDLCSAIFLIIDKDKKGLMPAAQWPLDSKEPLELFAVASLAVKNQDNVVNSDVNTGATDHDKFDYLASPIYLDKQLLGVIAVKTKHHDEETQHKILQTLIIGTKWLAMPEPDHVQQDSFYMTVVKLAVQCLQQDTVQQTFSVLINQLTSEFSCERVSIGIIKNHQAQIIALSNSAKFDEKSNLIQTISAAMDEAVDQDQITVYPEPENQSNAITYAHAELARKFGSGAICTIPFVYDHSAFAVLTMERSEIKPFDNETISICEQTLALISPFLKLKQDDEMMLIQKLGIWTKKSLSNTFGIQHLGIKLSILTLIVLTALSTIITGDYRIHADAVLEGRIQRTVPAPLKGFIKSANVRAGDTVLKGQGMAEMEDFDIKLEKLKLESEQQQVQREYRDAMANRDLVQIRILNSQLSQIDAKIKLQNEQLQRTLIKAPFDGFVIEGDLSQSLGAPVDQGDNLFKIAPLDVYRVILKVSERDISYIKKGQHGTLVLSSSPNRKFKLWVEKITEVAHTDEGSNIFRVEAALLNTPKMLRPGMEGIGKVKVGQKTLFWIWTHELTDWIKLWMWSWWP